MYNFMYHDETEINNLKLLYFRVSDISVLSDEETLMRVNSMGRVSWTPAGVFQTHCEADVTFYPLDSQECRYSLNTNI